MRRPYSGSIERKYRPTWPAWAAVRRSGANGEGRGDLRRQAPAIDGALPGGLPGGEHGRLVALEPRLRLGLLVLELPYRLLVGAEVLAAQRRRGGFGVDQVVEEGVEPVVVALRERVVLVAVALGAAEGQPQPDRGRRARPVLGRLDPELLLVVPADRRPVEHRHAVEAGGDSRSQRPAGQQVAGQLLDREPIEGHVAVEGVDHPVAVPPGIGPVAVVLVAVAVGIADQVEPRPGPALPEMRRGEQAVHEPLVGVGPPVRQELLHLRGRGRQAEEVQAEASDQRDAVRLGGRPQAGPIEPREDEPIDRVAAPSRGRHRREFPGGEEGRTTSARSRGPPRRPTASAARSAAFVSCRRDLGGGITSSGSSEVIRAISSLSSGSPATTTRWPPRSANTSSRESSRRFPFRPRASGPWHSKQFSARIGRICRAKSTLPCAFADPVHEAQRANAVRIVPRHRWNASMQCPRITHRHHAHLSPGHEVCERADLGRNTSRLGLDPLWPGARSGSRSDPAQPREAGRRPRPMQS